MNTMYKPNNCAMLASLMEPVCTAWHAQGDIKIVLAGADAFTTVRCSCLFSLSCVCAASSHFESHCCLTDAVWHPCRTSADSVHKKAYKALTFPPTLSVTSALTQKRKRSGSSSPVRANPFPSLLPHESKVCHGCGTSTTPLWRNGPAGPKTFCNACGTRAYRHVKKARQSTANHIAIVPPIAPASLAAAAV